MATPRVPPAGLGTVVSVELGPFELVSGEVLPELVVAYRHDGLAPADGPQVVVVHALTGSADAAGDWWAPLIGPGRALDTERYGVLCANLLGGRYGTTGPTSIDPASGAPWGAAFPQVSTRDQAAALWRLHGRPGHRPGGAGHRWIAGRHGRPGGRCPAPGPGGPGAAHGGAGGDRADGHGVEPDPDHAHRPSWRRRAGARPPAGHDHVSERGRLRPRFGRERQDDGRFSVISYLDYQGIKLVERFDGDTYRVLAGAMDRHDIGEGRGGIEAALARLAPAGTRLIALGIEDDILYGPRQVRVLADAATMAGVRTRYWS